jgi:hypothetical protein
MALNETHTLGWTPLEEGSAHRRDLYLKTYNIHKTAISTPGEILTAFPAGERHQTHALDRAATEIGPTKIYGIILHKIKLAVLFLSQGFRGSVSGQHIGVFSYDMIYLLTAIGLPPGGSSTAHIYTQTIHRTTQKKQYIEQHKNKLEQCGPSPVLVSYTLAFALQLRKKHGKTSVRVAEQ